MHLIIKSPEGKSRRWVLSRRKLNIGRDPSCDIVVDDPKISRIHAEILYEDENHMLVDKNSTNGSFVNGTRVSRQILMPGDNIILGSCRVSVEEGSIYNQVEWLDGEEPQITAQVKVDAFGKKISEITSKYKHQLEKGKKPKIVKAARANKDLFDLNQKSRKLMNHLNVIYNLSKGFTSLMLFTDLYEFIEKNLYDIFPEIERFCLITRTDDQEGFIPRYLSARNPEEKKDFKISRSIFHYTTDRKVSILTTDAAQDNRFGNAESIQDLNIHSIMCVPLVLKEDAIGALYCDNRSETSCFDNEDLELLTAMANQIAVAYSNAQLFEEVQRSYHEAILALINAIEAKDPYTMGHTQRTSRYALGIAKELSLSEQQCRRIKTAAELHDIGKIGIKEQIISKQTDLSDTEFHNIKRHVLVGEKILKPITYLNYVLPIIRGHHEHYDGSGYPDGLKGEEILLESRILAVADAFDAMTTQRPYNAPLSFAEALGECKKNTGVQFDPKVVESLERYIAANYELSDTNLQKKMQSKGETSSPFVP